MQEMGYFGPKINNYFFKSLHQIFLKLYIPNDWEKQVFQMIKESSHYGHVFFDWLKINNEKLSKGIKKSIYGAQVVVAE